MATSSVHTITGSRQWRCFVDASISSYDDDYVWVSWTWGAQMKWAYLYGIAGNCSVDGTQVSSQAATNADSSQYDSSGNWFNVFSKSGTTKVAKSESSRSITVKCHCWGETTSAGIGSAGGDLSCSVTLTVAARTYKAHGAPSITVTVNPVVYGSPTTINMAKSSTQGNANFTRLELWIGDTKLYSGDPGSKSVVPSNLVPITSNSATFTLKEIHDWYGTEKVTSSAVTVTIRKGLVTFYDSNKVKHTGILYHYDSQGKLHYTMLYAYDESGKLKGTT